jgi:hypothetical protein
VLLANNLHTLTTLIKETEMKIKRSDARGDPFGMKLKTRIGFWNVRTIEDEIIGTRRSWNEVMGIGGDRINCKLFMDALRPMPYTPHGVNGPDNDDDILKKLRVSL